MKDNKSDTAKTPKQKRSSKKPEDIQSVVEDTTVGDASLEVAPSVIAAEPTAQGTEVTKPMLGKVRRAFQKAGREASEEELLKFAEELVAASIPIMSRSSSRIAKVVKGEQTVEDLKVSLSRKSKSS
jgi:biotin carboxyl carrier protein